MTSPEHAEPGAFVVRAASAADLDAVLGLYAVLYDLQGPWRRFSPRTDPFDEALRHFRDAIADPDARFVVVAGCGGGAVAGARAPIVGMGMGRLAAVSSMSDERALDLTNVIVDGMHRGRGIGRAIVADLIGFGRDRGVRLVTLRVFTGNDEAMAFWSALGFRSRFVQLVADVGDLRL